MGDVGAAAASDARALERGVRPLAEADARRHFSDDARGAASPTCTPSASPTATSSRRAVATARTAASRSPTSAPRRSRRVAARDDAARRGERHEGDAPLFTAPELISDDAPIAPPSDVWALGVTLWVIVFGTPPFGGRGARWSRRAIEHAPLDAGRRRRRRPRRAAARAARTRRRGAHRAAAALTHAWSTRSSGGEAPWAPLGGGAAAVAPEARRRRCASPTPNASARCGRTSARASRRRAARRRARGSGGRSA